MPEVYLNGRFMAAEDAKVSAMDRGYLFGDGVYEVIPVYRGQAFLLEGHLARLQRSLAEIEIKSPFDNAGWSALIAELVDKNGGGDQSVYLQVTRGSAPQRDHIFPATVIPGVFMMSNPLKPVAESWHQNGVEVITLDDIRWQRCDIKAIALLANCLLKQRAQEAGAQEALLLRDGALTEGAASNAYIVVNGEIITAPSGNQILPGITRDLVLELAEQAGINVQLRYASHEELKAADEVWISSSTKELLPVTRVDGQMVGTGKPGNVWQNLHQRFQEFKSEVLQ
ncbi:D-amino-acid transaminase [Methylophaga sp. OBS3]|uniref:D-amino-acid transaminase n=1 Tax=Methylophaga sp. OBS3 TaxID=2991934 RepID=UPI002252B6A0|nr:D-amino-acid transaminase [Methylophaga sp. OBS3]MCX4188782.1 D-amino-acid transaminase [Methylophaga sp. OBS3]